MSLSARLSPRLYAVPERAPAPRKQNLVEIRRRFDGELRTKHAIDRSKSILDGLAARVAVYKSQIAALQRRIDCAEARAARIEDEIVARAENAGLKQADGFERHFELRLAPAAVQVDNASLVPSDYFRQPKTPPKAPDKVAIRAALEADPDLDIPGVRLTRKTVLLWR